MAIYYVKSYMYVDTIQFVDFRSMSLDKICIMTDFHVHDRSWTLGEGALLYLRAVARLGLKGS